MPPPMVGAFSMWYDTHMTFPESPKAVLDRERATGLATYIGDDLCGCPVYDLAPESELRSDVAWWMVSHNIGCLRDPSRNGIVEYYRKEETVILQDYRKTEMSILRGDLIRTPRGVAEVIEVRQEGAMVKLSDRPDHIAFYGVVTRGTAFWVQLITGELIDSM